MALSADDIKKVKGLGFLLNRGTDNFSARVLTENGVLSADQISLLAQAAEKFGNGSVTMTSRLTVELPGISFENIEPFREFIKSAGLETGGTGPRVRPIVACKGTTCVFGLYDTQKLASELHRLYYHGYHEVTLPHKFKIGVGGCPNNCVKPDINDLGIIGQRIFSVNPDKCRACKKCAVETECPMKAAKCGDTITIDASLCNHCGRCVSKCPFGCMENSETRYKITLGGRWGKVTRMGTSLSTLFTYDEMISAVEKAILLFKCAGAPGERFGATIDRLGISYTEKLLFSDILIDKKDEILAGKKLEEILKA